MIEIFRAPTLINKNEILKAAKTWGPKIFMISLVAYYSLGVAYYIGLMAIIDRIAIQIVVNNWGYMVLGMVMPTFQWYSAWGVRICAAIAAGILYDLIEKIVCAVYHFFFPQAPIPSRVENRQKGLNRQEG